jgi:hypothetical protein
VNKFDFVTQGRQTVRSPCGSTLQDLRYSLSVLLSSCLQLQPWQPHVVGAGAPNPGITAMVTPFLTTRAVVYNSNVLSCCLVTSTASTAGDYDHTFRLYTSVSS